VTHTEQLLQAMRRKWHTWGDLQALRVSTCPWRRLGENAHRYLKSGERIERRTRADGLLELRVVRG
jgi:hypothetical protein